MITKNFRLNALVNQYAAALYNHITATSGGEHFTVEADGQKIRVELVGGAKGVRDLIDGYALEAFKETFLAAYWESYAISLMSKCVVAGRITPDGLEVWQSMINDMGATVAGGSHA